MTDEEPATKQARQRCADMANVVDGGETYFPAHFSGDCANSRDIAFARHVQHTSDTMREIDKDALFLRTNVGFSDPRYHEALIRIQNNARSFILPEPEVDPLVEAMRDEYPYANVDGMAKRLREYFAKSGKKIMIVEAE